MYEEESELHFQSVSHVRRWASRFTWLLFRFAPRFRRCRPVITHLAESRNARLFRNRGSEARALAREIIVAWEEGIERFRGRHTLGEEMSSSLWTCPLKNARPTAASPQILISSFFSVCFFSPDNVRRAANQSCELYSGENLSSATT